MITYHLNLVFETEEDRETALALLREAEEEAEIENPFNVTVSDQGPMNELLEGD